MEYRWVCRIYRRVHSHQNKQKCTTGQPSTNLTRAFGKTGSLRFIFGQHIPCLLYCSGPHYPITLFWTTKPAQQ